MAGAQIASVPLAVLGRSAGSPWPKAGRGGARPHPLGLITKMQWSNVVQMVCAAGHGFRQQWRGGNVDCTAAVVFIQCEHLQICHPLGAVCSMFSDLGFTSILGLFLMKTSGGVVPSR